MIPIAVNVAITHPGVRIGFHAGSSCCENLEYLGFFEVFFELGGDCPSFDEVISIMVAIFHFVIVIVNTK